MDAVERALLAGGDCGDNSLMAEVMEDHIRDHLTESSEERIAPGLAEDLIDLIRSYVK